MDNAAASMLASHTGVHDVTSRQGDLPHCSSNPHPKNRSGKEGEQGIVFLAFSPVQGLPGLGNSLGTPNLGKGGNFLREEGSSEASKRAS